MTFSEKFERAIAFTLPNECEFERGHDGDLNFVIAENDPNDPGGVTKFGIDQRDHPDVDVASLDLDAAKQIYFENEWTKISGEQIDEPFSTIFFDASVNPGLAVIGWMQRIVGVEIDGIVGPKTVAAINAEGAAAMRALLDKCESYYRSRPPALTRNFLAGWLNRNNARRALLA